MLDRYADIWKDKVQEASRAKYVDKQHKISEKVSKEQKYVRVGEDEEAKVGDPKEKSECKNGERRPQRKKKWSCLREKKRRGQL